MTGITSRIIHSGRAPEAVKASISLRRFMYFFRFASEFVSFRSTFKVSRDSARSMAANIVCSASAPMAAVRESGPMFLLGLNILFFRQQLMELKRGQAWFNHDVIFEIENPLNILERHIKQEANPAWQ